MMKVTIFSTSLLIAVTSANPVDIYADWKPPGPGDVRGPCPVVNTLANHGFLPRNGRNFTREVTVKALTTALNFEAEFAALIWSAGLKSNSIPSNTSWDLEGLSRHNVLEHDSSLSRSDDYFGSNVLFNETIWSQTSSYFQGSIIDAKMMGNAKVARQFDSFVKNPKYRFTNEAEGFSIGEISAPFLIMGDRDAITLEKRLFDYLIRNERFPTELGWTKRRTILKEDQERLSVVFKNASSLLTEPFVEETQGDEAPPPGKARLVRRADPHGFDMI